jgi:hypothetical protein
MGFKHCETLCVTPSCRHDVAVFWPAWCHMVHLLSVSRHKKSCKSGKVFFILSIVCTSVKWQRFGSWNFFRLHVMTNNPKLLGPFLSYCQTQTRCECSPGLRLAQTGPELLGFLFLITWRRKKFQLPKRCHFVETDDKVIKNFHRFYRDIVRNFICTVRSCACPLATHHDKRRYVMEVWLHAVLISSPDGGECSSSRLVLYHTSNLVHGRLGGPQSWTGRSFWAYSVVMTVSHASFLPNYVLLRSYVRARICGRVCLHINYIYIKLLFMLQYLFINVYFH